MEVMFFEPGLLVWTILNIIILVLDIIALSILFASKRVNLSTIFGWILIIVLVPIFGAIFFLKRGRMKVRIN